MTQFIVDARDQSSETLLTKHIEERGGVQSVVGQMYQSIRRAEAAYVAFENELLPGGRFEALAAYHAAKQAPVADAVAALRAKMAEVTALMETMNAAMPDGAPLFPGVPKGVSNE